MIVVWRASAELWPCCSPTYARASFLLHPVAGELLRVLERLILLHWSVPRAVKQL